MNSKPKILELVLSLEKGGRTQRLLATAYGLSQRGYPVHIASFKPPPDWVKAQYPDSDQWCCFIKRSSFDLRLICSLFKYVKKANITCIHAHCESSQLYGGIVAKLANIAIIGTFHRSGLADYQRNLRWMLTGPLFNHAVAVSEDRAQLLRQRLKIKPNRIDVIHGGIDVNRFRPCKTPDRTHLQTQLGIAQGKQVLLSLGHLGLCKGHDDTLQALPIIMQQHPNTLLFIGGDGSCADYQRLNALINQHQLQNYVTLLGQVQAPESWLAACDIFVQPSLEEAFGLVFAEAGACGIPVVSTLVGGIPEIVNNNETGVLVVPNNHQALACALIKLLDAPMLRAKMGGAARNHIVKNFSVTRMVDQYERLIQRLL